MIEKHTSLNANAFINLASHLLFWLFSSSYVQIFVVYSLGNFHQNYRRYVRSYDPLQLHDGDAVGVDACLPFKYEGGESNASKPNNGATLPCGQIANSNFNDTYGVALNGQELTIDVRFFL